MKHYIEDKVVITGGSSGFGLGTARILLDMAEWGGMASNFVPGAAYEEGDSIS